MIWLILNKKVQFFEPYLKTKFISMSHIWKSTILRVKQKKGQFCESYQRKKSSILWVSLQKTNSILWAIFRTKLNALRQKRKRLNSLSQIIKGSILWVLSKNNSLNHIKNRVQFFESYKKGSILWVIQKGFDSLSHTKRVRFFESSKMGPIL